MIPFSEYKRLVQNEKRSKQWSPLRIGYLLHRDLSAPVSYNLLRIFPGVHPNTISWAMIGVGIIGAICLGLNGSVALSLSGIMLLYFSFLLDKVDGEIARYTQKESLKGVYIDELYHVLIPFVATIFFFLPRIDTSNEYLVYILFLLSFLGIFRRYERKLYMFASIKKEKAIENKVITLEKKKKEFFFLNSFLMRMTAIVERFDVFLVFLTVGYIFEICGLCGKIWIVHFLHVYTVIAFLYSLRWLIINYQGRLEAQVIHLRNKE